MDDNLKNIKVFFTFQKVTGRKNDGALNKRLLYFFSIRVQATHRHIMENAGFAERTLTKAITRAYEEGLIKPSIRAHIYNNSTIRRKAYMLSPLGKKYVNDLIDRLNLE